MTMIKLTPREQNQYSIENPQEMDERIYKRPGGGMASKAALVGANRVIGPG